MTLCNVRSGNLSVAIALLLATACGGESPAAQPTVQAAAPPAKPADAKPADAKSAATKPASAPLAQQPPAQQPAAPKKLLITLGELAKRNDLWPAKISLTKKLQFSPSEIYQAGQEFALVEFAGPNLHVDTKTGMIEIPAANTDVLERASALMASLTPEQLTLTAQTLPQHPELWPVELAITHELGFSGNQTVPVGRKVQLRKFEGDQLNVFDREFKNYYTTAIHETDIIARARERLKLPEAERTPFFLRSVAATLEPSGDAKREAAIGKADYVLVYEARLGCTRCAAFIPQLKAFYERMQPTHPQFEVVFVSQDFNAEDAKALNERDKLPGRIVDYEKRLAAADLGTQTQNGDLLPLVWLYDRNGKVVARNQQAGGKPSAEDLLGTLEQKLGEKR